MQNEETEKDERKTWKKQMAIHGDICGDMNIIRMKS